MTTDPREVCLRAGIDYRQEPEREAFLARVAEMTQRAQLDPGAFVAELLRCQKSRETLKQSADELKKLIDDLATGGGALMRLETIRHTPAGPQAVCRAGNHLESLLLHPDLPLEALEQMAPWDYVCVREKIVCDIWTDDPHLPAAAQGEVVDFKGYADEARRLARISRNGHEELVRLAVQGRQEELTPRAKLVLHRDNAGLAIGTLPADRPVSPFEVPLDQITTRLEDLAGMESLAHKLMLDIYKRIIRPEIRETFDLDPLRGMLLLSYKPGMGKTAFVRAFAHWLGEVGEKQGFDVVLYVVPPNSTKSMWHGEDARIVREEIFGSIRARREQKRDRVLLQILVLDEVDSLGRRPEAHDRVVSAAQSDAVQSFLAEMDGMVQEKMSDPAAHLLVIGMSNRPDMIDIAVKRPGRMGDLIVEMPELDRVAAEQICAVYARSTNIPFQLNGKPDTGLSREEVLARLIRPAVARVFDAVLLRYASDTQKKYDVTAGQMLVGTHYKAAMNAAKNRASDRHVLGTGTPAVTRDDVVAGLLDAATSVAASMQADPLMLVRQLQVKVPVARVEAVPREELEIYPYVDEQS